MRIAFIGFGEAARGFTDTLMATAQNLSFAAFDLSGDVLLPEAVAEMVRLRGTRSHES